MCALDTKVLARCCTLKIACRVRRWRSVKTNRGFLGAEACSAASITSFLLHAETETLIFEQQIIFTIHHHNHQGGGGKKENRLEHQWIKATEKKLVARTGLRGSGCFFCGTHFLCKRTLGSGWGKLRRSETVDSVEISIAIKTAACGGGPLNADGTKSVKFKRENWNDLCRF